MKSPDKSSALLKKWLEKKGPVSRGAAIEKAPEGSEIPLSRGQQRLWLLQQLQADSPFYHFSELYQFKGAFDPDRFVRSLNIVTGRHRVFSTVFKETDGRLSQVQFEGPRFELHCWEGQGDIERARHRAVDISRKPFNLSTGPLMRIGLIPLADDHHAVVVCLHHLLIDAWSVDLFKKEVAQTYSRLAEDASFIADELPIQFSDFAYWEHHAREGNDADYWIKQLQQYRGLPQARLTPDFTRPVAPSFKGQLIRRELETGLSGSIRQLGKALKTTDFTLFLSLFDILVAKYGGEQLVSVGMPVIDRDLPELQQLIGFFTNTLVHQAEVNPESSFVEFFEVIKENTHQALSRKNVGFDDLVKGSGEERESGINPLFQVMFVYHPHTEERLYEGAGLDFQSEILELEISKFDLTLHVFEQEEVYQLGIEYATELFEEATIERMLDRLVRIASQVTHDKNIALGQIDLTSEQDVEFLSTRVNHLFQPFTGTETVVEMIDEQFKRHKNTVAITSGADQLTYGQLDEHSTALARQLLAEGVRPGQAVAVYGERSIEYVVSIVAILRAGGAYVPLDPNYPRERVEHVLADADISVVIASPRADESLFDGKTVVPWNARPLNSNVGLNQVDPGELAYIIFTSGSTGEPKGIPVRHFNLVASTSARMSWYDENPASFLLMSSFAFDSSVAGVFWTLCTGGKLVISPERIEQDMDEMTSLIAREQVTTTLMLPSLYQVVLNHGRGKDLQSLRMVIVAGESCPEALVASHFDRQGATRLFNEYGPTEVTVWSTACELHPEQMGKPVLIGKAVPHTRVLVLDKAQQPVPIGLAGEIYLGGDGVVGRYLNRPELSEEKFVSLAHKGFEHGLYYATGDLGRITNSGELEFLGRADSQVKVRGYRIELDEIANQMMALGSVDQAQVVLKDMGGSGGSREKRLVAFYTSYEPTDADQIRVALAGKLPGYMMPAAITRLDEFPHLPNGKVDLKALSRLYKPEESNKTKGRAPETPEEKKIAAIWSEVLGVDEIGVEDNFFELGGDSIMSIGVIARCKDEGMFFTSNQFFRFPTIASLLASTEEAHYLMPRNELELSLVQTWGRYLEGTLIGVQDRFASRGGTEEAFDHMLKEVEQAYQVTIDSRALAEPTIEHIGYQLADHTGRPLDRIIPLRTTGDKTPLFCIHSEFYFETVFEDLTGKIDPDQPVYSVLSVSPELVREDRPTKIRDISTKCMKEIKMVQPRGPYKLAGFSISNVVAFDIAHLLKEEGEEATVLMMGAPVFKNKDYGHLTQNSEKIRYHLDLFFRRPGKLIRSITDRLLHGPEEQEKKPDVQKIFNQTGLLASLITTYDYRPCDVRTVLIVSPTDQFKYRVWGWHKLVGEVLEEVVINGDHNLMIREPLVTELGEVIQRNLDKLPY